MSKFSNRYNYERSKGEVNSGELKTVPDLAYTIIELYQKFRVGNIPEIERNVEFVPEDRFDQLKPVLALERDPVDIDEARKNTEDLKLKLKKSLSEVSDSETEAKKKPGSKAKAKPVAEDPDESEAEDESSEISDSEKQ